ncbi:MAG: hypothetical protein V4733_10070 [Verrucomicrobiota bacterium]
MQKNIIYVIHEIVIMARLKSYHKESHDEIAELLDTADHLCNLAEGDNDAEIDEKFFELVFRKHPDLNVQKIKESINKSSVDI